MARAFLVIAAFAIAAPFIPILIMISPFVFIVYILFLINDKFIIIHEEPSYGSVLRDSKGNVVRDVHRYLSNPNGNYKGRK
jgi:hypothetical protein